MGRIMPEVSEKTALQVIENLEKRAAYVHLNTQVVSAKDGKVKLSTGEVFESDLIIWTAGVAAAPVAKNCDFPLDARFRLNANAKLQIVEGDKPVKNAWTAGDVAAVPDLSGGGVGGYCVPNAQHAVRQAKPLEDYWCGSWSRYWYWRNQSWQVWNDWFSSVAGSPWLPRIGHADLGA
jgi:NADH dehydrogenase